MPSLLHRVTILIVLSLAAVPAAAQWYVGASVGSADASFRGTSTADQLLDLGFLDATTRIDDSDTMYRLHAGWRFHRFAAIELAYVDLGRYGMRSDVSPTGTLNADIKSDGADVSLVGLWPVWDRLTLLGPHLARTRGRFRGAHACELFRFGLGASDRRRDLAVAAFDPCRLWPGHLVRHQPAIGGARRMVALRQAGQRPHRRRIRRRRLLRRASVAVLTTARPGLHA
jgi:hypothetical protein